MRDISFIVLTWNSEIYLRPFFDSIVNKCEDEKLEYEIIVIDNGSNDDSKKIINEYISFKPDNLIYVDLDKNRGTTYPRNLGLRRARSKYICVIDSDTEINCGDLSEALNFLEKRNEVGILAPKLVLDDGSVQNSVKKFPTFYHKLIKIPKAVMGVETPNLDFYQGFPFEEGRKVDSAISACWFFRRELLESVGYFDENIFYSPEDLDFCLRVVKADKEVYYYPDLTILHHTQQISHKKPFSKTSFSHFFGLLYYFKKHGGWFCAPVD